MGSLGRKTVAIAVRCSTSCIPSRRWLLLTRVLVLYLGGLDQVRALSPIIADILVNLVPIKVCDWRQRSTTISAKRFGNVAESNYCHACSGDYTSG